MTPDVLKVLLVAHTALRHASNKYGSGEPVLSAGELRAECYIAANALSLVIEGYDLIDLGPLKKKCAMRQGFKFEWVVCPDCGQNVKRNWIVRHRNSGCRLG